MGEMFASDLQTYIEAGDAGIADSDIEATSSEILAEDVTGVEAEDFAVEAEPEVVPAEAFGAGATAGVVVAGVAAVAGVTAAGVVVKKKRDAKKKSSNDAPAYTSQPTYKPKGAGGNVFEFDATNHVSITGRSGAVTQSV